MEINHVCCRPGMERVNPVRSPKSSPTNPLPPCIGVVYWDNWPQDMPNEHRRLVDTANAPICCWPLCFHFELPEDTAPRFEPREEREIFILDMWCPRAKTATWSGSTTFNRPDPAVRVSTPSRLPSLPHPLLARRRRSLHCSSPRRRPIH